MWNLFKKIFLPRGGIGGIFVKILKLGGNKSCKK